MGVWRERFHAAAYTSLLMGAVFCRAYNQPFYPDPASPPDDEARQCRASLLERMRKADASYAHSYFVYLWIQEREREYLRRFPVFDLNDELGRQKDTFGPFIEWFIQSAIQQHRAGPPPSSRDPLRDEAKAARARARARMGTTSQPPGLAWMQWPEAGGGFLQWFTEGSRAEGEAVLWLIMQSMHMFEFILSCIVNADGERRLGRPYLKDVGSFPGRTRSAKVVLFGIFQAEEIRMPDDVMDSADQQLLAHTPGSSPASSPILDIPLVLDDLFARSGMANTIGNDDVSVPPPPLQFFTFTLRHHFNLEVDVGVLETACKETQSYHLFKQRATIFANGSEQAPGREWFDYTNGSEFLVEYDPSNTLTYNLRGDRVGHINPRAWLPWDLHDKTHYPKDGFRCIHYID
jgi:hypothetical protein